MQSSVNLNNKSETNLISKLSNAKIVESNDRTRRKFSFLLLIILDEFLFQMVPRRYAFELLSHFTDSDLEREKLKEFVSPAGQDELCNYCNRPKRTILEVLQDFPHATANFPLRYFFELFHPIRPRAFSIASSPRVSIILFLENIFSK